MFIEEEKAWLEQCRHRPQDFTIFIDNDHISIYPAAADGESFTFASWGENFILHLLRHIGCSAAFV